MTVHNHQLFAHTYLDRTCKMARATSRLPA